MIQQGKDRTDYFDQKRSQTKPDISNHKGPTVEEIVYILLFFLDPLCGGTIRSPAFQGSTRPKKNYGKSQRSPNKRRVKGT